MNSTYLDYRIVQAEIENRYGRHLRRPRRDSSLEITRRTMHRRSRQELHPGQR